MKQSFHEVWNRLDSPPPSLTAPCRLEEGENTSPPPRITTTIYVGNQGKLLFGRSDGSILIMNAAHAIMVQLLELPKHEESVPHRVLSGHSADVNCFLYPFDESDGRYDAQILLSGSADFSVVVWNIVTGAKLHRFCCQGGPILRMLVTPANSSVSV